MKRDIRRVCNRILAFLLVIAMELSAVNVPTVFAQQNEETAEAAEIPEAGDGYIKTQEPATDADKFADETGNGSRDRTTTEETFEGERQRQ